MQIWVDADACPIKEILYRAAERARVLTTLVANHSMRIPASPYIRFTQVPAGLDVADRRIVELLAAEDLVVTADIPLAAAAIERGSLCNTAGKRPTELLRDREKLAAVLTYHLVPGKVMSTVGSRRPDIPCFLA
jgi:uncharacterized protein YaiI (UPF0178 family)